MITRIEVDGFKSLRDFAVDLEPFTVFIGPNSAGKSNILEALALLSRLTWMPIIEAFKGGRGRIIDQFTRTGSTNVKSMRFAVEFFEHTPDFPLLAERHNRFRYELVIERRETKRGIEHLFVRHEQFIAMHREEDAWSQMHPELGQLARYDEAGTIYFHGMNLPKSTRFNSIALDDPPGATVLSGAALAGFHLLHLDSMHLSRPSERVDAGALSADASNLPTILAEMSDATIGAVRADLVTLVPGIASFDVLADKDEFFIEFELSGGERLPARLVSDGTLRILALLTALRMEPRPPILGIEEPENGVYPGRLRALLEKLRLATQSTTATQILLTTHSPIALSTFLSEPKHLRFIDMVRRNGERITRARTVGPINAPGEGRFIITPQEIESILDTSHGEAAE